MSVLFRVGVGGGGMKMKTKYAPHLHQVRSEDEWRGGIRRGDNNILYQWKKKKEPSEILVDAVLSGCHPILLLMAQILRAICPKDRIFIGRDLGGHWTHEIFISIIFGGRSSWKESTDGWVDRRTPWRGGLRKRFVWTVKEEDKYWNASFSAHFTKMEWPCRHL